MIEKDTVRLLRECDAGVKMGISSLDHVQERVKNQKFKQIIDECKDEHLSLQENIKELLNTYQDEGKKPDFMAKTMSEIKTSAKLSADDSDETVADLLTDGCNMGVKSLHKYLNQYKAADERSKNVTKKLIDLEQRFTIDISSYL